MAEQVGTRILTDEQLGGLYAGSIYPQIFGQAQTHPRPKAVLLGFGSALGDYHALDAAVEQMRAEGAQPATIDPAWLRALYPNVGEQRDLMPQAEWLQQIGPDLNQLTRFALTDAAAARVPVVASIPLADPQDPLGRELERQLALLKPGYEVVLQVVVPTQGQMELFKRQAEVADRMNGHPSQPVGSDHLARMTNGIRIALQSGVDVVQFVGPSGGVVYDPRQDSRLDFNRALARDAQFLGGMLTRIQQRAPTREEITQELAGWHDLRQSVEQPNASVHLPGQERQDILLNIAAQEAFTQIMTAAEPTRVFPLPLPVLRARDQALGVQIPLADVVTPSMSSSASPVLASSSPTSERLFKDSELDVMVANLVGRSDSYFPKRSATPGQGRPIKPQLVVVVADPTIDDRDAVLKRQHEQSTLAQTGSPLWLVDPAWLSRRHPLGELAPEGDVSYMANRVVGQAIAGANSALVTADLWSGPLGVGEMTRPFLLARGADGARQYADNKLVVTLASEDGAQLQGVQAWIDVLQKHANADQMAVAPPFRLVPPNPGRTDPTLRDLIATASTRFGFAGVTLVDEFGAELASGRCPVLNAAQMLKDARQANETLTPDKAALLAQGWQQVQLDLQALQRTLGLQSGLASDGRGPLQQIDMLLGKAVERSEHFAKVQRNFERLPAETLAFGAELGAPPQLGGTARASTISHESLVDEAAASRVREWLALVEEENKGKLRGPIDPAQWYGTEVLPSYPPLTSPAVAHGQTNAPNPRQVTWVGGEPGANRQQAIRATIEEMAQQQGISLAGLEEQLDKGLMPVVLISLEGLREKHPDYPALRTNVDTATLQKQLQPDVEQWAVMLARSMASQGRPVVVDLSSLPLEQVAVMAQAFQQAGYQQGLTQVLPGAERTLLDQYSLMNDDRARWQTISPSSELLPMGELRPWLAGLEPQEPPIKVLPYDSPDTRGAILVEAATLLANGASTIRWVNHQGTTLEDPHGRQYESQKGRNDDPQENVSLLRPVDRTNALEKVRAQKPNPFDIPVLQQEWQMIAADAAALHKVDGREHSGILHRAATGHAQRFVHLTAVAQSYTSMTEQLVRQGHDVIKDYQPEQGDQPLQALQGKEPIWATQHHRAYVVGAAGGVPSPGTAAAGQGRTVLVVSTQDLDQYQARVAARAAEQGQVNSSKLGAGQDAGVATKAAERHGGAATAQRGTQR